jgi:hypothetical protein
MLDRRVDLNNLTNDLEQIAEVYNDRIENDLEMPPTPPENSPLCSPYPDHSIDNAMLPHINESLQRLPPMASPTPTVSRILRPRNDDPHTLKQISSLIGMGNLISCILYIISKLFINPLTDDRQEQTVVRPRIFITATAQYLLMTQWA